ncbi:MAG: hypothetical protein IT249_14320 [Chitinophagaceae bacterium]|nr:hypothetical protein [Chitinophagaceae bacterium]
MEWNKKIYDHEIIPPENVWNKIVHNLDNECIVFRDKLFHAEEAPPENMWSKIAGDLDNEYILFKDILFNAEETPPPAAWNNIQAILDDNTTGKAPVISLSKILKIAAAAAIIGILFFTTNYFINTDKSVTDNHSTAQQTTKPQEKSGTEKNNVQQGAIAEQPAQASEQNKSLIASNTEVRKSRIQENNRQINVYSDGGSVSTPSLAFVDAEQSAVTDKYDLGSSFSKRVRNLKGEIKEDISLLDLPNSYFLMTGPDGQSIRVSSKFRNTIQYLNGSGNEELLDVILRESRYWKNIFREWKEKVGTSAFVPAANNFMDIAALMQLLHQNNTK